MITKLHTMISASLREGRPELTEEQESFFRAFHAEIFAFCQNLVDDREVSEEIVAQAFYTLFFSTHVSIADEMTCQIVLYDEAGKACREYQVGIHR